MLSHTAGVIVGGDEGDPAGANVPTLVQVHNGESPAKVAPVTVDLSRQLLVNAVVLIDFVGKYLATSGDLFPGASGPSPGVLETDDFVRSTNPGVTLKVRIVAVEEKAFQSVGLEHDRIGHSEPGAKALDGRFPRTVLS